MFKFSYNQNDYKKERSYKYPTDSQYYAYPDQVSVRTVAKTTTETYIFDSTADERLTLDLKLNIQASTAQISGALDFGFNMVDGSNTNVHIVSNYADTSLFQLYLLTESENLRDEFKKDVASLGATFDIDPDSYRRFIYRWGTHYVDSVVVGGSVRQKTTITVQTNTNTMQIAVALRGKFQSATGTQIEGSLGLTLDIVNNYVETETLSSSEIYGGDPEFTDFVLKGGDPDATATLFNSWKASLVTNPITIRYRLIEIWQLFDNKDQQKEMCKAIGTALGFLPEKKDFCDKVSNILSGTIQTGLVFS